MFKKTHAFTLIELLIVVAIIAILAAIAVPNFLEAQTRAKVSRFMSDTRTGATGLESYYVDNNRYPPPENCPAGTDEALFGRPHLPYTIDHPAEGYLPRALTTPVAFLTSLPIDNLPHKEWDGTDGIPRLHAPHYINDGFNSTDANVTWAGSAEFGKLYFSAKTKGALHLQEDNGDDQSKFDRSVVWHIHSHGADGDHDDFNSGAGYPTNYDPTNGTLSDGDIFYFGPGTGFTRQ